MTAQQLHAALGDISDFCILEAEQYQKAPRRLVRKALLSAAAMAACVMLLVLPFSLMRAGSAAPDALLPAPPGATPSTPAAPALDPEGGVGCGRQEDQTAPADPGRTDGSLPGLTLTDGQGNRTRYLCAAHLTTTTLTLPEGFVYGGEDAEQPYGRRSYYIDPQQPLWIYVKQTVTTDGTVDPSTGAMTAIPPQEGYVLYVADWLRDCDLVCVDGRLYRKLWSSGSYEDHAGSMTREQYDGLLERYGKIIRAETVDGFAPVGDARFTGYHTVPQGALAANTENAAVYVNPDEPHVVLVKDTWSWQGGTEPCYYVYLSFERPDR